MQVDLYSLVCRQSAAVPQDVLRGQKLFVCEKHRKDQYCDGPVKKDLRLGISRAIPGHIGSSKAVPACAVWTQSPIEFTAFTE
jgi:hypothetical protein